MMHVLKFFTKKNLFFLEIGSVSKLDFEILRYLRHQEYVGEGFSATAGTNVMSLSISIADFL